MIRSFVGIVVLSICICVSVFLSLVVVSTYDELQKVVNSLEAVAKNAHPTPIMLRDLKLPKNRPILSEVAFTGIYNDVFGTYKSGAKKFGYALIEPANATGPSVVLIVRTDKLGTLVKQIEKNVENERTLVRGFEKYDHHYADEAIVALKSKKRMSEGPLYFVEPFLNGRGAAINRQAKKAWQLLIVELFVLGLLLVYPMTKLIRFVLKINHPKVEQDSVRDDAASERVKQMAQNPVVRMRNLNN